MNLFLPGFTVISMAPAVSILRTVSSCLSGGLRGHRHLAHRPGAYRQTRSLKEMKTILDDNGMKYLELEFLTDWFWR
jgi:hypothetical protein